MLTDTSDDDNNNAQPMSNGGGTDDEQDDNDDGGSGNRQTASGRDRENEQDDDDDNHPDQDDQQDENPIEFVDDSCERNQNAWLRFPPEFINPAKMCSVNKYVQCVDETFLHHNLHHVPYGPEFVLVGHDSPSLPAHFLKWIWAMSQINCLQHYPNCVAPVVALTEVRQTAYYYYCFLLLLYSNQLTPNAAPGVICQEGQRPDGNEHQAAPGDSANMADGRPAAF